MPFYISTYAGVTFYLIIVPFTTSKMFLKIPTGLLISVYVMGMEVTSTITTFAIATIAASLLFS
jgi:hypothetical protein